MISSNIVKKSRNKIKAMVLMAFLMCFTISLLERRGFATFCYSII